VSVSERAQSEAAQRPGRLEPKLGVAVVGLGVGEQHARAYRANGRCELRWLLDLDRDRANDLAAKLGAVGVACSYEQILDDRTVQVVSIATYDDAHCAQVVAALEAGKHVFVEKPLCRTLDELRAIKAAWSRRQGELRLATNLVLRAAPLYRWLRQTHQEGRLGRLYGIDGEYLYGRLAKITEGWRKDVVDYSVIAGGGVHLIDLMLWIAGERPATVFAAGNRICTEGTGFAYPDYVAATLQYPSGLVGRVTANFGCVHRHHHVLRLYGTAATFLYDDAGARLHQSRDPALAARPVSLPALPASKGDLIGPFLASILDGDQAGSDPQPFFDGLSICIACDQSLRSGSVVRVNYL
jgi:predicted dehydrogenase